MNTTSRLLATLSILLLTFNTTRAQTFDRRPPEPMVTATASDQRVRYIAAGEVHQTRLQVFSADGTQVFDSGMRLGNLIDWRLENQQGQSLPSGSYLYLVTVKDFSERVTQKYGTAILDREEVYLEQGSRDALAPAHQTALEANRLSEVLSAVDRVGASGLSRTPATVSTDGTTVANQPTSTTDTPNVAPGGENLGGTGTENRLAKWTDNGGTLGDSVVTELNGNIGIGTTTPGTLNGVNFSTIGLHVKGTGISKYLAVDDSNNVGFLLNDSSQAANNRMWAVFNQQTRFSISSFTDAGAPTERVSVLRNGNVGIGMNIPGARLHVSGASSFPEIAPIAVIESSGDQIPLAFKIGATERARIRSDIAGNLVLATLNGGAKDIYFRAGDDSGTDMFIQSSTGNVGIGITQPSFRLHLVDPSNAGLRVQTNTAGGTLASFGGNGDFQIDAPGVVGGRFVVKENGRVGIGTSAPLSWLHVNTPASPSPISAMAIDVQSFGNFSNAQASHFFRVRDVGAGGPSAFYIRGDGNVGVGTESPAERLSVAGRVESTSGGFKFPDGSVQGIAANTTFTIHKDKVFLDAPIELPSNGPPVSVLRLNLPAGTYLLWATINFENQANYPAQPNNREFDCSISGEPGGYHYSIGGGADRYRVTTLHSVVNVSSGGVDVYCKGWSVGGQDRVFALSRRLTAVKIENVSNQ